MKSSSLSTAYSRKQKIIEDEQRLANRVKLLELEEQRTYKKIDETRKKIKEIRHHHNLKEVSHNNYRAFRQKQDAEFQKIRASTQAKKKNREARFNSLDIYRTQAIAAFREKCLNTRQELYRQRAAYVNQQRSRVQTAQLERDTRKRVINIRDLKREYNQQLEAKQANADRQYIASKLQEINRLQEHMELLRQRNSPTRDTSRTQLARLDSAPRGFADFNV